MAVLPISLAICFWLAGLFLGIPAITVSIGLGIVIFWQYRQQHLLRRWIINGCKGDPPTLTTPLEDIATQLIKQKRQLHKRKRKVRALIKRFRELSHAIPDAAMIVDHDGYLQSFNHKAQTLLDLDPKLDQGTKIDHLVRGEAFTHFWRGEHNQQSAIIRLPKSYPVYIEWQRIALSDGQLMLIARDVTNLTLLNQKRKAFVDNASHELKTPLTVISGFLEIMAEHPDLPDSLQLPVHEMRNHAKRMQELIQDMLQLATLEQNHVPLKESWIDVAELFTELSLAAQQHFPNSVGINILSFDSIHIWADKRQLYSALNNLIHNALLHAQSPTPVALAVHLNAQWIELSVSDDGIGMAAEHLPRITERFYRIDEQRATTPGTGLGLSIVRHTAEAHGGTLSITSEQGKGSSFTLMLPIERLKLQNIHHELSSSPIIAK